MTAQTIPALFAARVSADPASPLLTYYDDATGLRIELSGTTLDNWAAKTANLLVDETGLGAGDRATILLPPHWLHAAIALGAWAAGLSLGPDGSVVFRADPDSTPDTYLVGLSSLTGVAETVPPGADDFVTSVRAHGDRFSPMSPVASFDPATAEATHAELLAAASSRASTLGLSPGDRLLVTSSPPVLDWLLVPLSIGGSVVLVANSEPTLVDKHASTERTTKTL